MNKILYQIRPRGSEIVEGRRPRTRIDTFAENNSSAITGSFSWKWKDDSQRTTKSPKVWALSRNWPHEPGWIWELLLTNDTWVSSMSMFPLLEWECPVVTMPIPPLYVRCVGDKWLDLEFPGSLNGMECYSRSETWAAAPTSWPGWQGLGMRKPDWNKTKSLWQGDEDILHGWGI